MNIRSALIAIALMLGTLCATAQDLKIGYVDGTRVLNESAPAKQAMAALLKEFAPRERQIKDLQKQISAAQAQLEKERNTMPPSEQQTKAQTIQTMMSKSDRMAFSYAQDYELRRNEERAKLAAHANIVIKAVAEAGKFDLILQAATYNSRKIDITDQVIKEMAGRPGTKPK
jgi:outer membrane protein